MSTRDIILPSKYFLVHILERQQELDYMTTIVGGFKMEIMNLSAQEIVLISVFADLAKEAFKASELIKKHFDSAFGIGKKEIHVYHTESFGEYYGDGYLTIDGVFKYHDNWWGGRDYQFACDADGIYRMLRSCYLRENNLEHLNNEKFECQIERVDGYFREFIEELIKDKQN